MSGGGSVTARSTSSSVVRRSRPTRAARRVRGPQVVVLQVHRRQPGVVPAAGRGARGSRRSAGTWPPSRAGRPAPSGRSRAPVSTCSHRRRTSPPTSAPPMALEPVLLGVLAGPVEELPLHLERGDRACRRPARAAGAATGRRRPGAAPPPARPSAKSRGRKSSSIIASTSAVVPTLRKVATSDRLASPTMTWRRRYFWASAWGSSRVLTIGRFSVVSSPTSSSKKSARWVSWNGTSSAVERPRLAADLAGAGEDLAGDEVRHDVGDDPAERHLPVHQVVLVAAVAVALAVGVVLVDDDLLALGQECDAAAAIDRCRISSAARSQTTTLRGSAHSGVDSSGWAWST